MCDLWQSNPLLNDDCKTEDVLCMGRMQSPQVRLPAPSEQAAVWLLHTMMRHDMVSAQSSQHVQKQLGLQSLVPRILASWLALALIVVS